MVFYFEAALSDILYDFVLAFLEAREEIRLVVWGEEAKLTLEEVPHRGKVVRALANQQVVGALLSVLQKTFDTLG